MSESNNNIPQKISQLPISLEYEEGMVLPVAKAGHGTYQIDANKPSKAFDDIIENVVSRNIFDKSKGVTDGYVDASGNIYSNTTYHYSSKIQVSNYVGKTLYFGSDGSSSSVRFLCAYKSDGSVDSSAGSNSVLSSYTVPENIFYIVVSFATNPSGFVIEPDYLSSVYSDYYNYYQIKNFLPLKNAISIPQPTIQRANIFEHNDELIFDGYNSIKRANQEYTFFCKIPNGLDDNGYIIIGKNSSGGYAFGVSKTKWNYFVNGQPLGDGATHGLTLKDYLFVRIKINDADGIAYINIRTNGGTYSRTNTSWSGDHGSIYLKNECTTSVLDVVFTWTCESFRHRIWILGDSYISLSNKRWTYYLYDWEFSKNILINGYPGEKTRIGFYDWKNILQYGTPSIAIWCYGMNNPDNGSVNSEWLNYTRLFLEDCKNKDITPILATIPCIPSADNSYKNAWIRSSGYRYIEFANTVNVSQDSSVWYDDMLDSDNVHPNVQGAIALACQALEDVPEIMIN